MRQNPTMSPAFMDRMHMHMHSAQSNNNDFPIDYFKMTETSNNLKSNDRFNMPTNSSFNANFNTAANGELNSITDS